MLYLKHHGIKGQRWGIRRYQNEDGTQTPSGKKRYSEDSNKTPKKTKGTISKKAALLLSGGTLAAGALSVGTVWFLKNKHHKKMIFEKRSAAAKKGAATKARNKASGLYKTFKNADVLIKSGNGFVSSFKDVKLTKLILK